MIPVELRSEGDVLLSETGAETSDEVEATSSEPLSEVGTTWTEDDGSGSELV